jgi:hypothetical protein
MSKFIEYLKLIPKGLQNPELIVEGWLKDIQLEYGDLPKDEIEEIVRRRAICNDCPLNSIKAQTSKEYKDLYGENYKTERTEFHCSCCGCPINKKSASLHSDCGLTYYNSNHPDNTQILKWNKYKNDNN